MMIPSRRKPKGCMQQPWHGIPWTPIVVRFDVSLLMDEPGLRLHWEKPLKIILVRGEGGRGLGCFVYIYGYGMLWVKLANQQMVG